MNIKRFRRFLTSPTARLAASYLVIIMLMSIGFSLVFYNESYYQLGRQLPPDSLLHQTTSGYKNPHLSTTNPDQNDLGNFLHIRIDQGRTQLEERLLYLNLGALVLGSMLSYYLARRTLHPIEDAMEAQVRFVNDASHELRTPITAIRTSNDVALRNSSLTLQQAKLVISQNSNDLERLERLSEGLLSLARHDQASTRFEPIALQDLVSKAMTQVIPQAQSKSITVYDETADAHILGSKDSFERVLVILLDNAVKYSNEKGNVYIKTRRKGKFIFLDVIDEGVGILASDIPYLFRRFYRADRSRGDGERSGYGLGLSIAKSVMESYDGEISVVSKPDQGSTFTVKFLFAATEEK
jgi:two-component system sensor histidine kinase CiaH